MVLGLKCQKDDLPVPFLVLRLRQFSKSFASFQAFMFGATAEAILGCVWQVSTSWCLTLVPVTCKSVTKLHSGPRDSPRGETGVAFQTLKKPSVITGYNHNTEHVTPFCKALKVL